LTSKRSRLVGNSLALLANQITQNATSFLLSISIARILGPYELGQYTLAFTFYFIFMTMSSQGLKTLLTRELARNPQKVQTCLVSGTLLQFGFSLIAYAALALIVLLLPYREATAILCWIVGAALIPYGISNVTEAIFQSQEKMHLITISTVPIYILRFILMFVALKLYYNIRMVAFILVISEFVILFIEWGFLYRMIAPLRLRIEWDFIRDTARAARTFVAIESVSVFKLRMPIFFLSLLAGETMVGLYGATVQLLQPFQLISQSLVVAALPSMSRINTEEQDRLRHLTERIISVLLTVALPMIIGFIFIGGEFLVFMYRDRAFLQATVPLIVAGMMMIPLSVTRALSYLLMAKGLERINLRTVTINTILGSVINVLLIVPLQALGAAIAALVVEVSGAGQFAYAVRKHVLTVRIRNIIQLPLMVGLAMTLIFVLLKVLQPTILITVIVAGGAYSLMVGAILIQMLQLKDSILKRLRRATPA
jgi:O-antigen/teichoic acid export membrane protein